VLKTNSYLRISIGGSDDESVKRKKLTYLAQNALTNPRGTFYGKCAPVTGLPFCNDKLIGVWDFTSTTPEDDNQHGSHTASTTAGNVLTANILAPTGLPFEGTDDHAGASRPH
jgi:hypothetical protein